MSTRNKHSEQAPETATRTPQKSAIKSDNSPVPFPIVGIGTVVRGVEAQEAFPKNVRRDGRLAFVASQHLDPTHLQIMVEFSLQPPST